MKWMWLVGLLCFSQGILGKSVTFKIEVHDHYVRVESPEQASGVVAVEIHNEGLSEIRGKFIAGQQDLKYLVLKPTQIKVVEVKMDPRHKVYFMMMIPAFQAVPLEFGKKTYEIPAKK